MIDVDRLFNFLEEELKHLRQAQAATASVVRSLITQLRENERNRQSEDSRLAGVEHGLLDLIKHVRPRRLADITAEELAAEVPNEVISLARQIQYSQRTGKPLPLPPTPPPGESTPPQLPPREPTGVFALHHRDGERRTTSEIVGGVVIKGVQKGWKLFLATSVGGGLVHLLHRLGIM